MKKKNRKKITKHHIIPRSRGGENHQTNIIEIQQDIHETLHAMFGNKLPFEQEEAIRTLFPKELADEICKFMSTTYWNYHGGEITGF